MNDYWFSVKHQAREREREKERGGKNSSWTVDDSQWRIQRLYSPSLPMKHGIKRAPRKKRMIMDTMPVNVLDVDIQWVTPISPICIFPHQQILDSLYSDERQSAHWFEDKNPSMIDVRSFYLILLISRKLYIVAVCLIENPCRRSCYFWWFK